MKKWFNFFCFSFFSHKSAKEGARRGYTNVFLGFVLVLVFLWSGFVGGEMLPFGVHYNNSPDFKEVVHSVLANPDADIRIIAEIENGDLKLKKLGGEYTEGLLVNTLESDADKEKYSQNGYEIVIDTRPADQIAEIEAYFLSNDGKNTKISYEDYLTLSEVARLNFDFKIRYTGKALELTDESVKGYRAYVDGLSDENKALTEKLENDLAENRITKAEYDRKIYELYFVNYYPEITGYESTSKIPLLRNYYYHEYISKGIKNYLFIFDDYMTGSFETSGGMAVPFYGFFSSLENGAIVSDGVAAAEANASVDQFVKNAFNATWYINAYAYFINVISLAPFIALMLMVATLLTYSVMKLLGVESIISLGSMFKIIGSFAWVSGVISTLISVITAFFVRGGVINVLPLVLFFVALLIRSMIFAIQERRLFIKQLEQQEAERTEV